MEHRLVSEAVGIRRRTSVHPMMREARSLQVPDGVCHAVAPGSPTTACGLEAGGLVEWPQPWRQGEVQRCPSCLDAVPVA